MLILLTTWVFSIIASVTAGSTAEPATFGEPPTLELAIAAIVTLLVYSLVSRSLGRRQHVTDARPDYESAGAIPSSTEGTSQEAA